MSKIYVVKDKEGKLKYSEATLLDNPESLSLINHEVRIKILKLLSKEAMYPAEIAKKLKIHEQKIYYHVKLLVNAGILDIVEKKEIRGTTAKKFRPKNLNFVVALGKDWKNASGLMSESVNKDVENFLKPFIKDGVFNAFLVVGSPDPHGPFKARARDGHYAIDLSLFLGRFCDMPKEFTVKLDVNMDENTKKENLIVLGGPVTNLLAEELNPHFSIVYSEKKPWELVSKRAKYTDESIGVIAKIANPYKSESSVLFLGGIGNVGTKAAVLALTRHYRELLQTYSGQKSWARVVQGFDLDGDGKIDSVEILE